MVAAARRAASFRGARVGNRATTSRVERARGRHPACRRARGALRRRGGGDECGLGTSDPEVRSSRRVDSTVRGSAACGPPLIR
jgi:hypothetical protein